MTRDDLHNLMLLYAADLAEPEERAAAEKWLASGHPAAAGALAEARATLAAMTTAVDPIAPSSTQWAALEAKLGTAESTPIVEVIEAATDALDARRAADVPRRFVNWRNVVGTAAAAAIAALAVWLWQAPHIRTLEAEVAEKKGKIEELAPMARGNDQRLVEQRQALADARSQVQDLIDANQASAEQIARLQEQLDAMTDQFRMAMSPTVRTAELASTSSLSPDAVARAHVDEDAERVQVSLARFAPTDPSETYQLWILTEGQPPTSLGMVSMGASGDAIFSGPLPQTQGAKLAVAVSLEEAGGKPLPEGKIIAYGVLN
ncbi:MAG: anti-sigma factor [Planctomycetota bacterium]